MNRKIYLSEKDMPCAWYNLIPDLPEPMAPPRNGKTGEPCDPKELLAIFPESLVQQEMSQEPWIEIPSEVKEIYRLWRPSPLHRAVNLEKLLKTPARIYFKNESVSPAGSHKPNTAIAQAYYNKKEGVTRLATETGAGQWGSALSLACNLFGLECMVYMVRVSFDQKPYRKMIMKVWGGEVVPSPSDRTEFGRKLLQENPSQPGSLGIAISEAIEDTITHPGTKYSLGSVLNHVCLHQTIVGLETKQQLALVDEKPDILIGCVGGGSNFAGFVFPFVKDKMDGKSSAEFIGVEPSACPTMTKGPYLYDYGDTSGMTPLLYMYTLGHDFTPPAIHTGGLRYHGIAPMLSILLKHKLMSAVSYTQNQVFDSAIKFARCEGIVPAPESAHAIHAAVVEAEKCRATGEEKCIAFNLSGHGFLDLSAYDSYLDGKLQDFAYPEKEMLESIERLKKLLNKINL
ncbi:MAG: TrpB-like pyridoxal phosphate-dependent enzyme [Candidatus Ratteibacteria bacterium]|jgi:tryptophan synthase beta chain